MKESGVKVKDGIYVNVIILYMMVIILENALDTELDEELSCSQYDYRNKNR